MTKILPIKTYAVRVDGFSPILFSARTPSKARAACYRQYLHYNDRCTFRRFLEISSVYRIADPPGVGKRFLVDGRPAVAVIPACGHDSLYPLQQAFMRDDSDVIFVAHATSVHAIND